MKESEIIGHLPDGRPVVAIGDGNLMKRILALEIDYSFEVKQVMNSEQQQLVRRIHPLVCQFAPLLDSGIRPSRALWRHFSSAHIAQVLWKIYPLKGNQKLKFDPCFYS